MLTRLFSLVFAVTAFLAAPMQAAPVDGGRALVELISERTAVQPGETVYLGMKLELDDGWHVYWRNAGDAGLPPLFRPSEEGDIAATAFGEFVWPIPHLLPVVEGEIMDYGYDDEVVFAFPVTIPEDASGQLSITGLADYLICEEICVPESATISLNLNVGDAEPNISNGELIANWIAKAPIALSGEARIDTSAQPMTLSVQDIAVADTSATLRFFPYDHEITHSAAQPVSFGTEGATLSLAPSDFKSVETALEGVIVQTHADGTRVGYTVSAPVGAAFANTSGMGGVSAPAVSASSLLTIIFFALIGGLILNLMPCVLPVLSIKAMGMVSAAASGKASELRSHGLWYTAGVLISFGVLAAAIIAVRQVTGSATLGFQLQNAPTVAVLALIMFTIGLWLMGLFELGTSIQGAGNGLASRGGAVGAFFTGILAAVVGAPCVGPFLGVALGAVMSQPAPAVFAVFLTMGFGLALPFLILSFVPGLQKLLPKPGAWMETLKQFFAFPMFLTAAWLLSVLGALAGNGAVAWAAAGATLIAFGVWLSRKDGGAVKKVIAAVALIAGFAYPAVRANAPPPAAGASTAYAAKYETEVWSPERVTQLRADDRGIFVDFTATWCATCQVNKSTTLKTKAVQDAFAANDVTLMVADFTRKDPIIAEEIKRRNRAGVPMYLWYAPGADDAVILPEILSQSMVINLITKP